MDPNEALKTARAALAEFRREIDAPNGNVDSIEFAIDLADAFAALDGWLSKGGFLPEGWEPVRVTCVDPKCIHRECAAARVVLKRDARKVERLIADAAEATEYEDSPCPWCGLERHVGDTCMGRES